MVKTIRKLLLALLLMAGEASAQFCPGLPPWVFDDVPITHPFCTDITWMAQRGVTLGCALIDPNHRLYCPDASVDRGQMAAFMYRLGFQNAMLQGGNAFGAKASLGTTDNHALELMANNQRVMHYESNASSANIIGGHLSNFWNPLVIGQTIAGGGRASDTCFDPVTLTNTRACANRTENEFATVSGGYSNHAKSYVSTVGGGTTNTASNQYSTIGGGYENTASGYASTVPGGDRNVAQGNHSFATGKRARALYDGQVVFGGSHTINFEPVVQGNWGGDGTNTFNVRATGGAVFVTAIDGTGLTVKRTWFGNDGNAYTTGTFIDGSDRAGKERFEPVAADEILRRVVEMPVTRWSYQGQADRHLGPTAQDFRAAFGLGGDDKTIATIDSGGVALAAIQGLNAKLEHAIADRDARLAAQAREIAALHERVARADLVQADVAALKAALAELRRERAAIAAR